MTSLLPTTKQVRPIILGGDIGSYASARAFHEAFGVPTVILAGVSLGAVAHSTIVDLRVEPDLQREGVMVRVVQELMKEAPDQTHLLLGSADWWVEQLVLHRDLLAPAIVPYAPAEVIGQVSDKAEFTRICNELNIPTPRTATIRPGDRIPGDLPTPMAVKAASSGDFQAVEFPGKRKVEFFNTHAELGDYLDRVEQAGYGGEFVVQEFLPGGDDAMAAVNAFYGADGKAQLFMFGQILLEEHTPNGLGNSVAQITGSEFDHPSVAAAQRFLDHVGWVGFANFDLMLHPDGTFRFLELNPRVGRSGYAVTAAGHNVAKYYVNAFIDGVPSPDEAHVSASQHLFVVVPLTLLRKYAPAWIESIKVLKAAGAVTNPLYYRAEHRPKRWRYIVVAMINQFRKFARHHPTRSRRGGVDVRGS